MTTTCGPRANPSFVSDARTASAAAVVVTTAVGRASRSAVSRRSACPWSSGANNGTAIMPALIAAKNPAT